MSELVASEARAARRRQALLSLALLAVLALGAALRFYRLSAQSLWNDEGTSVALAGRSLAQITFDAAADIHPPFYHYLLHYWLLIFGNSEAGARSLSALFGLGLILMVYLLGRRLFSPLAGWAAALLIAVSPYQVYYSQEARMYMLLAFLGAASSYLFYRTWLEPGGGRRAWTAAGWVLVTVMVLYTHYLGFTIVLAQDLAWGLTLLRQLQRGQGQKKDFWGRMALGMGAQALAVALFLPWLRLTWEQLHQWPAVSPPFGLLALLKQALPLFALGPTAPTAPYRGLVAAVLGLAALGLVWPKRSDEPRPHGRLLAFLLWVTPVLVLYYLSRSRPVYHPKFLVLATPGFALLLGRGVACLAPGQQPAVRALTGVRYGLAGLALLAAVGAGLPGLRGYYFDPRYARDDYRGIAQYISAMGRPGDVVLINAPSQIETVAYYYHGPLELVPMARRRPPDRATTIARLTAVTQKAQRVFGIFWATGESDPERIVEGWLDSHAYKALDAWYGNVRLVIYAMPSHTMGEGIQNPLHVDLGGEVQLDGYSLGSSEVAAGDILQLNLYWEATNVIRRRYKVFTHVIDANGRLVGQRDSEPGGGLYFTNTWREGEQVTDRYGLPILAGTPPGEYLIEVGMYNPDNGLRLPVMEGGQPVADRIILQKVRVTRPQAPPPLSALDMQHPRLIKGDDIQLLGYSFGRLGAAGGGPALLSPQDTAELVLFWQAVRVPEREAQVVVRVVDQSGQKRLEQVAPPAEGRYPLTSWQPGEIVRDPLHLPLAGLTPGRYRLLVGWQAAPGSTAPQLSELLTFVVQ